MSIRVIDLKDYKGKHFYDEEMEHGVSDIEDIKDFYRDREEEMPQFVYAAEFHPFKIDYAPYLIENEIERYYEGIEDNLNGIEELNKAIDEFNKANIDVGDYIVDEKTLIKLY